jgi:N-acetylneuraminic acid mutarotase
MMAYASWSVVFGEQPSAAKWNILGANDASFNDGTGLNNGAVQQVVYAGFSAVATGTTVMPNDDTIPQNTEGDQYMTLAITPKSTTNTLVIEAVAMLAASGVVIMGGAIFQDSTANALYGSQVTAFLTGAPLHWVGKHSMTAGTTSSTTFKFRAGVATAATITFNGIAGARIFGAINKSMMRITEYKS